MWYLTSASHCVAATLKALRAALTNASVEVTVGVMEREGEGERSKSSGSISINLHTHLSFYRTLARADKLTPNKVLLLLIKFVFLIHT